MLAGDSAHVNSPIGAMGMNSGVHDAFNLADKLIRILRKEAGHTLDTRCVAALELVLERERGEDLSDALLTRLNAAVAF